MNEYLYMKMWIQMPILQRIGQIIWFQKALNCLTSKVGKIITSVFLPYRDVVKIPWGHICERTFFTWNVLHKCFYYTFLYSSTMLNIQYFAHSALHAISIQWSMLNDWRRRKKSMSIITAILSPFENCDGWIAAFFSSLDIKQPDLYFSNLFIECWGLQGCYGSELLVTLWSKY